MTYNPCKIEDEGVLCYEPAAYRASFIGCAECLVNGGTPVCQGHSACIKHAAMIRAGTYEFVTGTSFDHDADLSAITSAGIS